MNHLPRMKCSSGAQIWREFGPVLKEGLHFEPEARARLTLLVRYETTKGTELSSLAEYVERMGFRTDLAILTRTLMVLLGGEAAGRRPGGPARVVE